MDKIAIYLRKSRADEELEKTLGEGETLSKHRKALLKFAKDKGLNIVKIYEEIVSGESLIHRTEMLELLKAVENKLYTAVLVMDKERLGRGDMQEQGLILNTFKEAKCKIITPQKTYDLNNEFDEEYSEFEAFMSRREFKMINRRMQGGRVRAVEDGNYIGTYPPYGYNIKDLKVGRTLEVNEEQAAIVKMIFDMYVNKNMGCSIMTSELNSMGLKTYTGIAWYNSAVINILKNPVYIGLIAWKKKRYKKPNDPSKRRIVKKNDDSEVILVKGKHEPIIDEDIFNKAQNIFKNNGFAPAPKELKNPLAGLIMCGVCGNKMQLRPYYTQGIESHIVCSNKCGNKSSKLSLVEGKILEAVCQWYNVYILPQKKVKPISNENILKDNIKRLEASRADLEQQRIKVYDLLEQGVYDANTFVERSQNIAQRIEEVEKEIENCKKTIEEEKNNISTIPDVPKLINAYKRTKDITKRNQILKSILLKVEYRKEKGQKLDNFTIEIYPINTSNL